MQTARSLEQHHQTPPPLPTAQYSFPPMRALLSGCPHRLLACRHFLHSVYQKRRDMTLKSLGQRVQKHSTVCLCTPCCCPSVGLGVPRVTAHLTVPFGAGLAAVASRFGFHCRWPRSLSGPPHLAVLVGLGADILLGAVDHRAHAPVQALPPGRAGPPGPPDQATQISFGQPWTCLKDRC